MISAVRISKLKQWVSYGLLGETYGNHLGSVFVGNTFKCHSIFADIDVNQLS